ncbi:MAG: anti-sigma factor antagonist [Clostridia bacterium]|nr:anti-sigma factor antagonist [Clostridia bacterium]
MKEEVDFSFAGRVLTVRIKCEIDHHTARRMRDKIDEKLYATKPELLVLDFSEVRFMDSSGLGLIIGRSQKGALVGASVRLCGLSDTLYKLIRLSGIEKVKNITVLR